MSRDVVLPLHRHSRVIRSLSVDAEDDYTTLSARERPQLVRPCSDTAAGAGGLRMTREPNSDSGAAESGGTGSRGTDPLAPAAFRHAPVMLAEVTEAMSVTPQGVIVDATVGGAGHAAAILQASTHHRLVGIDRDGVAVAAARARLEAFGARAVVVRARFDEIGAVLEREAPGEPVSGVLFDLGVSSMQFDDAGRGFSYRFDAPLDMRMDREQPTSARHIVNEWSEDALAALLAENGETRFARRIARTIVSARPIETTSELSDVVRAALPGAARRGGGHPAKRVFQAVRIAVNGELDVLPRALEQAMALTQPGGRVVVLSYHSGEDRITKRAFAEAAAGWCTCPQGLPCICGAQPAVRVLTRGAAMPGPSELAANPRSSSARLRIAERLDVEWRARTKEDS